MFYGKGKVNLREVYAWEEALITNYSKMKSKQY